MLLPSVAPETPLTIPKIESQAVVHAIDRVPDPASGALALSALQIVEDSAIAALCADASQYVRVCKLVQDHGAQNGARVFVLDTAQLAEIGRNVAPLFRLDRLDDRGHAARRVRDACRVRLAAMRCRNLRAKLLQAFRPLLRVFALDRAQLLEDAPALRYPLAAGQRLVHVGPVHLQRPVGLERGD